MFQTSMFSEEICSPDDFNNLMKMLMPAEQNFVPVPTREYEVFVYRIPHSVSEQELRSMFEKYGDIFALRLVIKDSSKGKNYAFVRFTEKIAVRDAVLRWNGYEIRRGHRISVCKSILNNSLVLFSIPKYLYSSDIYYAVSTFTSGLEGVHVCTPRDNRGINSGVAVLMYSTHNCATIAKKILISIRTKLWNRPFYVDWYVPSLKLEDYLPPTPPGFYPGFQGLFGTEANFDWNFLAYSRSDFSSETYAFREYKELTYSRYEDRK